MVRANIIIGLLSLAVACDSYATDSDRIAQLEKEVQELKLRLSKLESSPINADNSQQPVVSAEGWKSVANWRQLTKDMSTADVRKILGEPQRITVGAFTYWYYENDGRVIFYDGKVSQWMEPRN